jgi:hypothetical protein
VVGHRPLAGIACACEESIQLIGRQNHLLAREHRVLVGVAQRPRAVDKLQICVLRRWSSSWMK